MGEPIENLGLSESRSPNKFIPHIYKYSSIENRLSILQGLMDTDGHCMISKNGKFLYSYGDHLSDYGNSLVAKDFLLQISPFLKK